MSNLGPLHSKLDPMIRMLGGQNDHEVLAAARAIKRLLEGALAIISQPAEPEAADVEDYWKPPKPKRGNNDFVAPKRRQPPPRPSEPPLWEVLEKTGRLSWMRCIVVSGRVGSEDKEKLAPILAQAYSQPHIDLKPAQRTLVNRIFVRAWIADVRPVFGRLEIACQAISECH